MKNYYINGIGCVSAQESSTDKPIASFEQLSERIVHAAKPNYRDYIKPAMIRRMSTGVKMGVVASSIALKDAKVEMPDAIVSGSGLGCAIDSDKFLKKIVDNNEEFLTPTAFIQSTHNTVGAQVALGLGCKSYNVSYVHNALSFESALIDAQLMLDEGKSSILCGGVDELGDYTTSLFDLIGHIKKEGDALDSTSKGAVFSEGSQFFVIEDIQTENTYAKLIDLSVCNTANENEVEQKLMNFLDKNGLSIDDIDAAVLGVNDDVEFDSIYKNLKNGLLKETTQLGYKHLSGEYNTVSAFGLWATCNFMKSQEIPENLRLNSVKESQLKTVLLYNQYRGENHSFTLLSVC